MQGLQGGLNFSFLLSVVLRLLLIGEKLDHLHFRYLMVSRSFQFLQGFYKTDA